LPDDLWGSGYAGLWVENEFGILSKKRDIVKEVMKNSVKKQRKTSTSLPLEGHKR
jgi:hypothetical protein